ncbi:MAG: SurA N-terminal domain-containing protein [Deltaproteobacteria bacterium]|nr:SurA N-terminal domain-containing protein [Deltaproteobacteria bacterium]
MLDVIRKNVRHPYIQALLGMVILVFILFFGWSVSSQKPTYVAKVNGDVIGYRAYQQAYDGMMKIYQEAFGAEASADKLRQLGVGRRALDQLVDQTLLMQEADRRDLTVSNEELQAAIQAVPVFLDQGRFVKDRYLRVLEANRITPKEFEEEKRREILLNKVEQSIRAEAKVSDADVHKEYEERNTKIDVEFVAFDPAALKQTLRPSESDLRAYFDANKESYRTPEKRIARFVLFAPDAYLASVSVSDQEISQEFAARSEQFAEKEAVRARHILLKVEPGAKPEDEAKVKKRAEAVLKEARATKDFGALARKYSEDPGSKDKGGELGLFGRGQMVPEFEKAAFALKPGQVSDLVKTSFGYHIIEVEEHRAGGEKTLEQVRPQIEADLKKRKALEEAYKAADRTLMELEDRKQTWDGLRKSVTVETSPPITRGQPVPGVAKPAEFAAQAFSLDPQKPGNLFETERGTYLVGVEKVLSPAIPPLEEVKAQVEERYRDAESRKLAEKNAEAFLAAARTSGWDAAVKQAGVKPAKTGWFARKGGAPPAASWPAEIRDAAFSLASVGALAAKPYPADGKVYALRLAGKTAADPGGFDTQKEALRAQLLPAKQMEHLQETLKRLRSEAKIKINEELLIS